MPTVYARLGPLSGTTGMLLYVHSQTAPFTLLNTGGDVLTEIAESGGMFQAAVEEELSGTYDVRITLSNGAIIFESVGGLNTSVSFLVDDPAAGAGSITNITNVTGGPLTYAGPVREGGTLTLKQGDSYTTAAGNAIDLTVTDVGGTLFAKLDGEAGNMTFGAGTEQKRDEIVGTISGVAYADDVTTITIEVTAVETAKGVPYKPYDYDIQRATGSGNVTDVTGCLEVTQDRAA